MPSLSAASSRLLGASLVTAIVGTSFAGDPPAARPAAPAPAAAAPAASAPAARITEKVAGTAVEITLVPVPGCDGTKPFFMATTEVPWELFDAFIYHLDKKAGASTPATDAVTRPTKPYVSVDRGFGHQGWPAISMSAKGAVQFCEWLSAKTGRTYRLPTLAEWRCAAAQGKVSAATMQEHAWMDPEANVATQKVGTKKADALGIFDLWGNAAEWVTTADGGFAVIGGSYREEKIDPAAMQPLPDTPDWNESDPQFPKSVWWLVDGPFIGMRVVTSDAAPKAAPGAPAGAPADAQPRAADPAKPAAPAAPAPAPAPASPSPAAPKATP
ncbi:MAG: SUMF1/EgtB/PvdO family nonheme iron enzyme [Phycisphaerales bacterium]